MVALDYYRVLEIPRTAVNIDINNAYRRLALKYVDDAKETARFREIAEAYTVLMSAAMRARFDQYGEEGLKKGDLEDTAFSGSEFVLDPHKVFEEFFGSTSPVAALIETNKTQFDLKPRTLSATSDAQPAESENNHVLECELAELFMGHTKSYTLERRRFDENMKMYMDTKTLLINLEPGWLPGITRLRFQGEGHQLSPNDKKCADIFFTIKETPHPLFERAAPDSLDLLYVHKCGLKDALTGHKIDLELLDSQLLHLWIPETVSMRYEKRFLGRGFKHSSTGACGDLVVRWEIEFPELSAQQREALKQIL